MSVVTTEELSNYMSGWRYSDVQLQDAQAILDGVQSDLELYLNRPLQRRRLLEQVTADFQGRAWMKVTPIVAVHGFKRENAVTGLHEPIPGMTFDYRKGSNFIRIGAHATVLVDYTAGINADVQPNVKLAIKRVAAREFTMKHDDTVTLENTEGRVPEDATPTEKGWTVLELAKFDRMRRRTIV